jgi:cytochrome d ubiquinol oxidase subunit II
VRHRARRWFIRLLPVLLLPIAAWALTVQFLEGKPWTWALVLLAVAAAAAAWTMARKGAEGKAFVALGAFLALGSASIFGAAFPVVLPSTLNEAFDLTISNASSSDYTLGLMTVVAAFGLPLVIAYQAWTYWVFRKRVSAAHIPEAHSFLPAVAAKAFTNKG